MFLIVKKLGMILNHRQKVRVGIIAVLMLIGALLETFSVSLIIPLISAVMDKDLIYNNEYARWVCELFDLHSTSTFILLLIIFFIIFFVGKNVFLLMEYYVQYRFVFNNQFATQKKLMDKYLNKPYEYFLHQTTETVLNAIREDVSNTFAMLTTVLSFFTEACISGALVIMLFVMDPFITILVAAILGSTMLIIASGIKPQLRKAGVMLRINNILAYKWLLQSISGIKEVKVAKKEDFFLSQYEIYGRRAISAQKRAAVFSSVPRLFIETISICGMLGAIGVMIFSGRDLNTMIPQLSAFAMAAVRLMPSVNRLSTAYNMVSVQEAALDKLAIELRTVEAEKENLEKRESANIVPVYRNKQITSMIKLQDITYAYPGTEVNIFEDADMIIPAGKSVGLIGSSGAGKTTAVDIILGLLAPQRGRVLVDDMDIKDNYGWWLSKVGYIPQMIFMLDDTIRANVAFGIPDNQAEDDKIWDALEEAKLKEFVRGLPDGLDTTIGERGVRLSGGQRQRIGIARALYSNPEVLIFDEATSAVDNETEAAIMESINSLHGKKTMIIIAHRLTTIEGCDMVYQVEDRKFVCSNIL